MFIVHLSSFCFKILPSLKPSFPFLLLIYSSLPFQVFPYILPFPYHLQQKCPLYVRYWCHMITSRIKLLMLLILIVFTVQYFLSVQIEEGYRQFLRDSRKGKVRELNVEIALIGHCLALRLLFCHYLFVLILIILLGFPPYSRYTLIHPDILQYHIIT